MGQAARLVVVRLERVEQAGHCLTNAVSIAARTVVRHVILEPVRLECLFAQHCKRAVVRVVGIVKKHSNCTSKRSDLCLQVDDAVCRLVFHATSIQTGVLRGESGDNLTLMKPLMTADLFR
jgi:hypothetical protein